ncbi:MAG TPA: HNH endonuclease family protein, partial [Leptospiraceae bacterium]|nr:HNH endonuclease family protein [Leptospiraceae bacterium]
INLEISDEEYDSFDEDDENSFPDFLENDDKSIARATKRISEITDKYSERLNSFMSNYDILNKVLNKEELQKRFLERKLPEQLLSAVNDYNSPLREPVSKLLLLLIFHNYFLNNIIFAQISVSKEAFAFDIFDSLNSTGDPLTAFETFRPLVIKNTENYSKSSEKKYLTVFSEYLAKKKEDRLTLTKRFIISLALYENGAKDYEDISETLNRQRKYLRNTFEKNPDERTNFCHSFARLTYFYQDVWEKNLSQLDNGISEEAKVSLAVLRKTKHTLTIPILARYYSELILGKKQPDYTIFSSVIKGITVFSLFWRLINAGSTAGIDDVYKELIKSRISRNVGTLPSLSELLKILRNDYLRKFSKSSNAEFDEKTFIEKVSKAQYTNSKSNTWLKFFLLAALHDSIPDPNEVGLDIKGTPKCNTMLNIWGWESSDRLTLEHIAPQRPENINNWENKLLLPDYAHSIGNLTLLPKQQNSIAGNKDWKIKKEIYSILSSDDNNTRLSKILKLCEKYEIDLTKSSEKTIKNSDFWPCIKSISKVNKWTSAIVEKRADRLAGLGWETLSPWLGY